MIVKIYKDYKMPTQSGRANINEWILEFMSVDDRFQEQIMGWTGSENMYPNEVKLRFENKKQAITFAKKNKFLYRQLFKIINLISAVFEKMTF
jgi:hypothetical protein